MSEREYEIVVDAVYCKGCGLCVEFCPQGKFSLAEEPNKHGVRVAVVDPDVRCTGCRQCAMICPDAAVRICRLVPAGGDAGPPAGSETAKT